MLAQFNITGGEAEAYADKLGLIPANVNTAVTLMGVDSAIARARTLKETIDAIPNYKGVSVETIIGNPSTGFRGPGSANGNLFAYANGGFASGFYRGGTPLYKFAEPETRWEAFILGKQGQEDRNRAIALESYRRLGGEMPVSKGDVINNIYEATNAREVAAEVSNRRHMLGAV